LKRVRKINLSWEKRGKTVLSLQKMESGMDWFKKHVDTVIVLTGIFSSMVWINGKFDNIQSQINDVREQVVIMKTVMIMKDVMPKELAVNNKEEIK